MPPHPHFVRTRRFFRRLAVLASAVAIAACAPGGDPPGTVVIDTLRNGAVRVRNPDRGDAVPQVDAERLVRIGAALGAREYEFGRITGLLLGDGGTVYVLDQQATEIRAFDGRGRHLRTQGRAGGGPGEYSDPRGMQWSPAGTLWVMDYETQRYTVLTGDLDLVATYPRRVPAMGSAWAGRFDRQGRLLDLGRRLPTGDRPGQLVYIRHAFRGSELVPTDTFDLPDLDSDSYFLEFPGGLLNIPVPHAPQPAWAYDGRDGIWYGTGAAYSIIKRTLAGDTVRVVEVDRPPVPVSADERAAAIADLVDLAKTLNADRSALDPDRIPSMKPFHGSLRIDDRDRLWVARYRDPVRSGEEARPSTFDVFTPAGVHIGSVTLELDVDRPMAFRADTVAGVLQDANGVERVVVFRITGLEAADDDSEAIGKEL